MSLSLSFFCAFFFLFSHRIEIQGTFCSHLCSHKVHHIEIGASYRFVSYQAGKKIVVMRKRKERSYQIIKMMQIIPIIRIIQAAYPIRQK